MGLSEEGEETILHRYEDICLDLNMDGAAKEDAWQNYQRIIANYSLEVSKSNEWTYAGRIFRV